MNAIIDSVGVPVDVSGDGDHILVPAVVGKWHRLMRIVLTFTYEDEDDKKYRDVQFKSGSNPVGGPLQLTHGSTITLENDQRRWMEAAANEPVVINLGDNGRCTGTLTVYTVDV